MWTAEISPPIEPSPLFNVLVAADGEHSRVRYDLNLDVIQFKAKQAIGITCNFVNSRTRKDSQ